MVSGHITSVLEKQRDMPSAIFTFIVTRQASKSIVHTADRALTQRGKSHDTCCYLSHDIKK